MMTLVMLRSHNALLVTVAANHESNKTSYTRYTHLKGSITPSRTDDPLVKVPKSNKTIQGLGYTKLDIICG